MNLQIIQKCIQAGYTFEEEDSDEVGFDNKLIEFIIHNDADIIKDIDEEDIVYVIRDNPKKAKDIVEIYGKSKVFAIWREYYEICELYSLMYDDDYYQNIDKLSKEDLEYFINHMTEQDEMYNEFSKIYNFEKWAIGQLQEHERLEDDDFTNLFENYFKVLTYDIVMLDAFQYCFSSWLKNNRWRIDVKMEIQGLYECFGPDDKLKELLIYHHDIEEEFFLSDSEKEEYAKEQLLKIELARTERFNNLHGRLTIDDCRWYLDHHKFSKDIHVNEGYVGLEDMSFDHIVIDGKIQGEIAFDRAWINGRSFGDNQMETSVFLETVNKYLVD